MRKIHRYVVEDLRKKINAARTATGQHHPDVLVNSTLIESLLANTEMLNELKNAADTLTCFFTETDEE